MSENFDRLPADRKRIILNACIQEFAEKGYARASTNAMVRRAGIPKGTLFFFFGSKKAAYLSVLKHAVGIFARRFEEESADRPSDIFDRLLRRSLLKARLGAEEPLLYKIVFGAFVDAPKELAREVNDAFAPLRRNAATLFDGIDASRFKDGVDVKKAVEITSALLEGLGNRYMESFRRCKPGEALGIYKKMQAEAMECFEILKHGMYR